MKLPLITTARDFSQHFRDEVWLDIAATICRRHDLSFQNLKRAEHGENIVFFVDDSFVIKIYTPFRDGFKREKAALEFACGRTSLPLPEILFEGETEGFDYLIFTQLEGVSITRKIWLGLEKREQVRILTQLGVGLKELHSHDAEKINFDWHKFIEHQIKTVHERQRKNGANAEWLERLPFYLEENLKLLPDDFEPVFMQGDVHFGNLRLLNANGKLQISGLFDFADSLKGFHEYEFLAPTVLMIQAQGELQREFFRAYGYRDSELDERFRRRLMLLTILYECSDLRKYALRLKPEAIDYTLDELERAIWNFVI